MSQAWTVTLEVVAPPLDEAGPDEVRSADIGVSANSRATAGAKAVALAKSYGWKVLSITDIKPAQDSSAPSALSTAKLLSFPMPSSKPN